MSTLSEYAGARELVVNLTLRELRSKYKKSVLGWTWSLLNPVASVVIYTIVFSVFLKVDPPRGDPSGLTSFVVFLLCALVPWNFFAERARRCRSTRCVGNANLIKKVYFPRELLVIVERRVARRHVPRSSWACSAVLLLIVGNMVLPWIPVRCSSSRCSAVLDARLGLVLAVLQRLLPRRQALRGDRRCRRSSTRRRSCTRSRSSRSTSEVLGVDIPVRQIYELNPLVPLRRGVPRRALRPPLPELGPRIAYLIAWTVGVAAVRLAGCSGGSSRDSRRKCERQRRPITVDDVSKRFRLYHERNQSLKASVMRGRRARYEEFWALRDVSFEVPRRHHVRAHRRERLGQEHAAQVHGADPAPRRRARSPRTGKISALLELGAGFHPELSGRENVYLNGAILGPDQASRSTRGSTSIVDFAGIEQFIDTPVKNYSSGMYVRLGFSVAINVDPDILLIDEVLAVGDAEFQRKCREKIAELPPAGQDDRHRVALARRRCARCATRSRCSSTGNCATSAPPGRPSTSTSPTCSPIWTTGAGYVRWGSREVRIERVEMLDANGAGRHQDAHRRHRHVPLPLQRTRARARRAFGLALNTIEGVPSPGPTRATPGSPATCLEVAGSSTSGSTGCCCSPAATTSPSRSTTSTRSHPYDHVERIAAVRRRAGRAARGGRRRVARRHVGGRARSVRPSCHERAG